MIKFSLRSVCLAIVVAGVVYAGGLAACPLTQVSPPMDPQQRALYAKFENGTAAAQYMVGILKEKLEAGQVEFLDEHYRAPFVNKLVLYDISS
ncbi:MAG: hypothetical protein AB1349_14630 [Elusimicrobiota bacterium]